MDPAPKMSFSVELTFYGNLRPLLAADLRRSTSVVRQLREKSAIKDVIEACGIPHSEVDLVAVRQPGQDGLTFADLSWQVSGPATVDIHPAPAPPDLYSTARRLQLSHFTRFVADGHLGKLARNLRLLGIDTAYAPHADDRELLRIMLEEDRALLTRDRRLLMHSIVKTGYCPRSTNPHEQTREVLHRFHLLEPNRSTKPFTRCLRCNGLLVVASKSAVTQRLLGEPKTLQYYTEFHECSSCGKIYWPGTHFTKLAAEVAALIS